MSRKKRNKKRRILKVAILLLFIGAVSAAAYFYLEPEGETSEYDSPYEETTVQRGSVISGVTESGTVEFGTMEQTFTVAEITEVEISSDTSSEDTGAAGTAGSDSAASVQMTSAQTGTSMSAVGGDASAVGGSNAESGSSSSGTETSLEVEEVYVSPGQTVQEGDQILKLTEESILAYREQLQSAVEAAGFSVTQEEINVESKQAQADYTYEMYLAEGESAEETYNATIESLEAAVEEIEEQIEEEDDEDELEELEAELKIAQNNLQTQSIEAKQTYENAMTNYKYADQLYEIEVNGLEDDLNEAKDLLKEAETNLEEFEEQIGDGIIYAEYTGTVTEIAYEAGDMISSEGTVVTYMDPEDASMTVSVSQEDISEITVGDEVSIALTAYDDVFTGEVVSSQASSETGSATVNYEVEVCFTGDTGKVYSGMTGEVTFAGKTVEDVLYVSNRAVQLDGSTSWVRILNEDGTVSRQEIETGFSNGTVVEVQSGLEEGQTVLIESQVSQ